MGVRLTVLSISTEQVSIDEKDIRIAFSINLSILFQVSAGLNSNMGSYLP